MFFSVHLTYTDDYLRGTAVHELAHIIDANPYNYIWSSETGAGLAKFSEAFERISANPVTSCGYTNNKERFAEGVTDWVYGRRYSSASRPRRPVNPLQVQFLNRVLKGWGNGMGN